MNHQKYMHRCIELALKGLGSVAPNPLVGAVLVHNDIIIGEGWHQKFGEAHAEVNCINSVSELNRKYIAESVLYVSLEPCNHYGKTPPCSDLILKNNIKKVVVGCVDINPKVGGSGIKKLIDNHVEVIYPIMDKECKDLNKRFFTFQEKHRPYIFLKWAQTNDGFIAAQNYTAVKISNEIVDKKMHLMRSYESAIMVGFNTAFYDNPKLTARLEMPSNQPLRIVIDKQLKLPNIHYLLSDKNKTLVLNQKISKIENNVEFFKIEFGESFLNELMKELFERKILSLIVEGGTTLLQSFISENLWDEAIVISNTEMNIGNGIDAPVFINTEISNSKFQNNLVNTYFNFVPK